MLVVVVVEQIDKDLQVQLIQQVELVGLVVVELVVNVEMVVDLLLRLEEQIQAGVEVEQEINQVLLVVMVDLV